MEFFAGVNFYCVLIAALVPAVILGICERDLKIYRRILTCLFIYLVYKDTPGQLVNLLCYSLCAVISARIYLFCRVKYGRNIYIYRAFIIFLTCPLILSRVINFSGFLGLSYIYFRVIQIIIEIFDGVINNINYIGMIDFLLFFPALSSGPIDRSRRFELDNNWIYNRSEYINMLGAGLHKIIIGLVYQLILSSYFYELMINKFPHNNARELLGYTYSYVFFNFAGYSALAIGTGYILGIKLPQNFNKPFISIDIKEFWSRWHISLSSWFRDFVFSRIVMSAIKRKFFKNKLSCAVYAYILNMTLMGIWHGLESQYIIYGFYHGLLLALNEIYQRKSNFYAKYKDLFIYKFLSWLITLNLVMFGFLIFSGHMKTVINALSKRLFMH